jgi:hypothetical protein
MTLVQYSMLLNEISYQEERNQLLVFGLKFILAALIVGLSDKEQDGNSNKIIKLPNTHYKILCTFSSSHHYLHLAN